MLISLDTEATGLDFAHGAMPFLVTTCSDEGIIRFWEWDVDPYTRKPDVIEDDLVEITELIDSAELIYLQNSKFDAHALATLGIELPWSKVRDTLCMGHLLASNLPHNLTWMVMQYIGVDIEPLELKLKEIVKECRAIVKKEFPDWKIAKEGEEGMPSVKDSSKRDEDKPWKNDSWLPRTLFWHFEKQLRQDQKNRRKQEWLEVCPNYANGDSEHTMYLGLEMEKIIRSRGLWKIYEHRMKLPNIAYRMEEYGLTAIGEYTEATINEYQEYIVEAKTELVSIASEYGHDLELAEGASINDNMRTFFYGLDERRCPKCKYVKIIKHWNGERADDQNYCPKCYKKKKVYNLLVTQRPNLKLPVIPNKKTGNASLDKDAMQEYMTTVDGTPNDFLRILLEKRARDTAVSYMEAYRKFWVPAGTPGYYRIHASLNPFATDHLRWASNSPNLQNVSKKEEFNLRACFGPLPDREWWSMDFQNIELRVPAYESGETKMIEVFEKPDDPPYWGSYHNLIASIVYKNEYFANDLHLTLDGFKKKYKSTLYQWIKNFNFAKQYGCGKRKGDATARKKGAFDLVDTGLPRLTELQNFYLDFAIKNGYVQTMPDKTVDPIYGYPILASRTEDGRVLSTTPFNYHVSGTACWCKNKALIRCQDQLDEWREEDGFDGNIALEIHDEILFDFPRGVSMEENLERALVLKRLMEESGDDIGIPTPCSIEYHNESWAKGIGIAV